VIAAELVKQGRRPRAWVTLAVVAALPALLTLVIGTTRPAIPERFGDWGSVVTGTSGLAMPLIALSALQLFLLPLAVAIMAAEPVAGEASWGSLRYLLARPVSRSRVLAAKAAVAAGFSLAAVAAAAGSALLTGVAAFGWRPLTVLDLQRTTPFHLAQTTFAPGPATVLLGLATMLVALTMTSTFAVALLLSTLTDSPFAAAAGGVGFGLVSRALDNVPGLQGLSPWLPLTDGGSTLWTGLFLPPADAGALVHLALVQALYTLPVLAAATIRFARADVLA